MKAYRVSTFPDGILPVIEQDGLPFLTKEVDLVAPTRVYFTKKRNTGFENVNAIMHIWFSDPKKAMAYAVELMEAQKARSEAEVAMLTKRLHDLATVGVVTK